ncbi:TonB-dependent receptor [Acinetobacter baumannii]|uniref:TonB-dependent receptor n=1 Tax=Acinetobacter baumannii TaxID=470 RepID=UPI0020CF621B|nr:TonB-dependent siderophore receptor [Acinetobacter baumannii]MCQ1103300.1 TonB-dependent siderophore receptor [Acinetobacter baumannii]MDH2537548.1 TonB-dependent siderophore receptor [Acinetobacter baumannii]
MLRISISSPQMKRLFPLSLLSLMILNIQGANAEELIDSSSKAAATMPTIKIEAMSELDPIKSYIDYDKANVTRNGLNKKDIPQTVDTIDVQKYKIYGSNDLSVMLQGTPGVSTSYDMRGDGITIRGFGADTGDIYRDGIRESGQVRRSTANIERIEILKGPASVLYGRSAGGGVVNMVSKFANFDSKSSVGAYAGSYDNYGTTADINQVLNDNLAVRLTGEYGKAGSFRSGIENKIEMFSPSFTYKNDDGKLTWTTQYTYDKLNRVPDRGPTRDNLPAGTSIKMGFAQDGDYVDDILQVVRTDVNYEYAPDWNFHWAASYRQAEQNFDHFYFGNYCGLDGKNSKNEACTKKGYIDQIYYWQQTSNKTTTNTFDIKGKFKTGQLEHQIMVGTDWTYEQREPRLANKTQNGSDIYGYVNPITGEREYSRGNGPLKISQHNYNEGTTYGVFMQDLIGLNDQLKLMMGLRYDYFDFSTTNKIKNEHRNVKDSTFSPNVGLVWQPVPEHSFYTSYSKSFAPFGGQMGVNQVTGTTDVAKMDKEPQYNEQYEVGVKSEWFDNRLNTQFSVFDIRKNNIRYKPNPDSEPEVWATAGQHQSRGLEFSFIGRVLDNVFVRGGYGYTDAKVKEDNQNPEREGNYLANTSKNTGNLFVRYLPTEQWYTEVGVTYVGSYYPNINNQVKMEGFNRVDAAIGYSTDPWNVTLAVNNLTNKEYWRSDSMPGTPRNVLLRLNYQF